MKLNVRQAARVLSVSESEIYRWVESGEIPCLMVKHQPLFGRAELLEWATARRLPVSLELFEHGDDGGASLRLADVLERGGVHHDVPGIDRASVLRAIVERLPLGEDEDPDLLLQILLARESTGSSGIGEGIAIPHVRSPLVFPGMEAIATLSYLASPVAVRRRRRKAGAHGLHARQPNDPRPSATSCQAIGCASRCRIQGGGLAPRRSRRNPRRGASGGGGPGAQARGAGPGGSLSWRVGRGMTLLLLAVAVLVGTGVLALVTGRWPRVATGIAALGTVVAAVVGLGPALESLRGRRGPSPPRFRGRSRRAPSRSGSTRSPASSWCRF